VSKRRELDISAVAAGLYVETGPSGHVTVVRAAFGGMAATPARAGALEAALPALARDFRPLDDHRGSAWFRGQVAENLVRGFYLETVGAARPEPPARPASTVHLTVVEEEVLS